MYNLSFYHGTISISETERRLRQLDLVGSFLLRSGERYVIVSYLDEELKTQHEFLPRTRANMLIRNHQDLVGSPQKVFTFLQSLDTIWTHPVDRGPEVRYDNSFYTFRLSVIHSETVSNFEFNKMIIYCFQEELGERNNPDGGDCGLHRQEGHQPVGVHSEARQH